MSEYVMMEEQDGPAREQGRPLNKVYQLDSECVIEMKLYFNLNRSVVPINIC